MFKYIDIIQQQRDKIEKDRNNFIKSKLEEALLACLTKSPEFNV